MIFKNILKIETIYCSLFFILINLSNYNFLNTQLCDLLEIMC